jgi:hypothetical protein
LQRLLPVAARGYSTRISSYQNPLPKILDRLQNLVIDSGSIKNSKKRRSRFMSNAMVKFYHKETVLAGIPAIAVPSWSAPVDS